MLQLKSASERNLLYSTLASYFADENSSDLESEEVVNSVSRYLRGFGILYSTAGVPLVLWVLLPSMVV